MTKQQLAKLRKILLAIRARNKCLKCMELVEEALKVMDG